MSDGSAASVLVGGMLTGPDDVAVLARAMVAAGVGLDWGAALASEAQAEAAIRSAVASCSCLYLTHGDCSGDGVEEIEEVCDRLNLEYIGWQGECPGVWDSEIWRCGPGVADREDAEVSFPSNDSELPLATLEDLQGCATTKDYLELISEMVLCTSDSLPVLSMLS